MSTPQCSIDGRPPKLHVFFEDAAWHWAICVPRERGCGFQVVAYNEKGYASESEAMSDGSVALGRIAYIAVAKSRDETGTAFRSVAQDRRR